MLRLVSFDISLCTLCISISEDIDFTTISLLISFGHTDLFCVCMFQTFSGNTALHIVSSLPNHKIQVEAVKLLMRKGADPGARNFENELPAQLVPEGPIGEMVECEKRIVIQ